MKTSLPLKAGAIALALLLAGAYVYDRAGGNLLPRASVVEDNAPAASGAGQDATLLERGEMLPGSKSTVVWEGMTPLPSATLSSDLLPGSKSIVLIDPADPSSAYLPQAPYDPYRKSFPKAGSPELQFLPGSKSDAIFRLDPEADAPQDER